MHSVVVYVPVQDGVLRRAALEVITRARDLSDAPVAAAVLGPVSASIVEALADYGVADIFHEDSPAASSDLITNRIAPLVRLFQASGATMMMMPTTEEVRAILGALAVTLDAAPFSDVSEVSVSDDTVNVTRPVMAAKRWCRASTRAARVLVSVRTGAYGAARATAPGPARVHPVSAVQAPETVGLALRALLGGSDGEIDLSEATAVVAAGRGVRDDAAKALVYELAGLLKAGVGASRAVVETGAFPATAQIGQTGKVVAPELYIGVGISGAIQHVAGMRNSRVIVAINKDPDAPIFQYATYGIVGDLYKVLPPLIETIRSGASSQ